MEPKFIEVKHLEHSPHNARRSSARGSLEELKASILAHGLMQNLVVTAGEADRYHVIAGGRRLEALRALQQECHLPDDYAVPCQLAGEANALEMSLAENTVRLAMHPADEFDAYARLIGEGESAEQIARRFGVTAKHVEQRLTLGKLAPELIEAYRNEELTLDCLMAFTITGDRDKQLQVFGSLAPWQADNPREIRSILTGEMAEGSGKLARFVGLEAYHAAGGTSRADLFSEHVYLENPALLHQLAADKLDAACRALEEEGWGWVECSPDRDWSFVSSCQQLAPQPVDEPQALLDQRSAVESELEDIALALEDTESDALLDAMEAAEARMADIDTQLAAYLAYDPEQMRLAGCYVSIGHHGELEVEKGLVRRQDAKRLTPGSNDGGPRRKGLPESLRRDLEAYRLQAAQVEIARHRLIALDLLSFKAARSVLARRPVLDGPDVQFTPHVATNTVQAQCTKAGSALEAIAENLPRGWLHQETEAEQFQAFLALSDSDKLDFLAYAIAVSLKPQLSTGREGSAYELALSLTDAELASYWRPTRANYLGRITRDQLLALGRQLLGEPWAQARSRDKKGELADALERAFADPDAHGRTPQQREALRRWLPDGMTFDAALPATESVQRDAA